MTSQCQLPPHQRASHSRISRRSPVSCAPLRHRADGKSTPISSRSAAVVASSSCHSARDMPRRMAPLYPGVRQYLAWVDDVAISTLYCRRDRHDRTAASLYWRLAIFKTRRAWRHHGLIIACCDIAAGILSSPYVITIAGARIASFFCHWPPEERR